MIQIRPLALVATRCQSTHLPKFEGSLGDALNIKITLWIKKGLMQRFVLGIFPYPARAQDSWKPTVAQSMNVSNRLGAVNKPYHGLQL